MSTHTPGPWRVETREHVHAVCCNPTRKGEWPEICFQETHGDPDHGCITGRCRDDEELTANARLIAAAPELLETCRDLSHLAAILSGRQHAGLPIAPVMWSMLDGLTNKADAAIAKVEGIE